MLGIRQLKRAHAGETIVEVLIAIAVVSAVLGSSFAVINKMLQNSQQTQEHEEALKLLEGQVETLKVAAKQPTTPTVFSISPTTPFCLNGDATVKPIVTADDCKDGRYLLSINRNGDTFHASATWDGPTGGQEKIEIVYEVFP